MVPFKTSQLHVNRELAVVIGYGDEGGDWCGA